MKRLITVIGILVLVSGLSLCGIFYAGQTRQEMYSLISEAQALCDKKDSRSLVRLSDEMIDLWEKKQTILSLYVRHDELEKMSVYLVSLKGDAEKEIFEGASVTLEQMVFLADHIYQREMPNMNNLL